MKSGINSVYYIEYEELNMKRIFLLVTGIVLIGGIASAQINVGGGVSAWVSQVDPSQPAY